MQFQPELLQFYLIRLKDLPAKFCSIIIDEMYFYLKIIHINPKGKVKSFFEREMCRLFVRIHAHPYNVLSRP